MLDLPSRGDTCFPAIVAPAAESGKAERELAVHDYSSPIDGADLPWSVGQRRATNVYRHHLHFTRR